MLCLGSSAFLIVDSTFHGHWHVSGVGHQAPCSGKFSWLGNHASLANRTGASVEVAKTTVQSYVTTRTLKSFQSEMLQNSVICNKICAFFILSQQKNHVRFMKNGSETCILPQFRACALGVW